MRIDGSALANPRFVNTSTGGGGTITLPTFFDEIDPMTGIRVQSIPVPQLLHPTIGSTSPIWQRAPVPPNADGSAASVGITNDVAEGQGSTSSDGCFLAFTGYESYTYTTGWIARINATTNLPTPSTGRGGAMDSNSDYPRVVVTVDGFGNVDTSQRTLAFLGITGVQSNGARDFYHQPRATWSNGRHFFVAGDGGLEFFRRDEGNLPSHAVPSLAYERSDDSTANFRGISIGPPGPRAHLYAMAQKPVNVNGVQDARFVDQVNGGLRTPYDFQNRSGAIVWYSLGIDLAVNADGVARSTLPLGNFPGPVSGSLGAPGGVYAVWAVDAANVWVLDTRLGISWYRDTGVTWTAPTVLNPLPGVVPPSLGPNHSGKNFTLMFGPERPFVNGAALTVGLYGLAYVSNVTLGASCVTYADARCVGAAAPVLAVVTSPSGAQFPSGATPASATQFILRFDPSGTTPANRWSSIISTAPVNSQYRGIGFAPVAQPGVCFGQPAVPADPSSGAVASAAVGVVAAAAVVVASVAAATRAA